MNPPSDPSNTAPPRERYPSPQQQQQQGLPFYQPQPQHEFARDESMDQRQQDGGARESIEQQQQHHEQQIPQEQPMPHEQIQHQQQMQQHQQQPPQAVPDDPQLRANLNSMMGFNAGYPMAPPTTMQSMPQTPIAYAPTGSPDTGASSAAKPKDRTKVSRACDECRRKKIRCDAVDETGSQPCSNCARTNQQCLFSRQPMKRGPSKGYIKELADRLVSLESQVNATGGVGVSPQARYELQQMQQVMAAEGYGGQPQPPIFDPRIGDKRTHDVAEGLHNGFQAGPGAPVAQMQTPRPMAQHQYPTSPQQTSPSMMPGEVQPFWRRGPANNARGETGGPVYEGDGAATITNFDWDETVINEYYRIIHQTFPLLPNSKQRLQQRLADCPTSLREAFLAALDCLMRTFPTTTLAPNPAYHTALKKAAELLARYPFDNPSTHTNATNLVYLQTLLLMALETDNHGPATIRGQAGPSRAEWLGRAAGVAGQLEINVIRTASSSVMEGDRDSEERLARRVWWVLFILDRWHASSTADLLKLPENSVVLLPEDQILLGESTYHLARLSFIIGHLAAILTTTKTPSTDVMAPTNPASTLLGLTLAGEIDRFRESVESVWGSLNLVHLSYHHCHLLIKRLNPQTEPVELVGHAVKVATVLNSRMTPVTPLNHHFAALAAMTLCELCDVRETRDEALRGLDQMVEALDEGRGLAGKEEGEGWDEAIRKLVVAKKERMRLVDGDLEGDDGGLQSLANAAVGGGGGQGKLDPTWLTRYGYLTALGQGMFRSR